MKRLPVYFYVIVLILGAVVTRESISGMLHPAEQAWRAWLQAATLPNPEPRVTLVTAENADGLLSPLDVALFLRAAMRFEAGVAGIAASEIDRGEEELLASVITRPTLTKLVAGAMLSPDAQSDPVRFATLPWTGPLPDYSGVWNNLPAIAPLSFGFLNLPENGAVGSLPVLTRWKGETVVSFSYACLSAYLQANGVTLESAAPGRALSFSNHCAIPISANAEVALKSEQYPNIARISLEDLLVASEKRERQPDSADPAIVEMMQDRIVILAPAPSVEELRSGAFTLGQFQALGVASLAAQLQLPAFGPWLWWVPFLWFFPWLRVTDSWQSCQLAFGLFVAAIYAYAAFTLAPAIGLLLPGIPALAWALALPVAVIVRRKSKSA